MPFESIQPAKPSDLDSIMELFRRCTDSMIAAGIQQWDSNYPVANEVEQDIGAGHVFGLKEGNNCLATITLNERQDEQYHSIEWHYQSGRVIVIHRLAVHPEAQGRGLGQRLCKFAEDWGSENGFEIVRLDAYEHNPIARSLYEKMGYRLAGGRCYFHARRLPFNCYEKQLA